jgi:hypothetical protein
VIALVVAAAIPASAHAVPAASNVASISRSADVTDIFVRGADNRLYTAQQLMGSWYGWSDLGAPTGGVASEPSVISWDSSHLDVFVRGGDGALWHRWWSPHNDWQGWSPWLSLGGQLFGNPKAVALGYGRAEVAVRANDNAMWIRSHVPDTPGAPGAPGGWKPWEWIGGAFKGDPAVTSWAADHVSFAGVAIDDRIYEKRRYQGNWWSWLQVGANASTNVWGPAISGRPSLTNWGFGRLNFYGGHSMRMWDYRSNPEQTWGNVWALDSAANAILSGSPVAVAVGNFDDMVFARSTSHTVVHKRYSHPNWTSWTQFTGTDSTYVKVAGWSDPTASQFKASESNQHVDVFAVGEDGKVRYKMWNKAPTGWEPRTGWVNWQLLDEPGTALHGWHATRRYGGDNGGLNEGPEITDFLSVFCSSSRPTQDALWQYLTPDNQGKVTARLGGYYRTSWQSGGNDCSVNTQAELSEMMLLLAEADDATWVGLWEGLSPADRERLFPAGTVTPDQDPYDWDEPVASASGFGDWHWGWWHRHAVWTDAQARQKADAIEDATTAQNVIGIALGLVSVPTGVIVLLNAQGWDYLARGIDRSAEKPGSTVRFDIGFWCKEVPLAVDPCYPRWKIRP